MFSSLSDCDPEEISEDQSKDMGKDILYHEVSGKIRRIPDSRKIRLPTKYKNRRVLETGKDICPVTDPKDRPLVSLNLDRRLPFQTSANYCTRPLGHMKDRLIFIGKSLKRSAKNCLAFRQLLVGTVFSEISEIPVGLLNYTKTNFKGNVIIDSCIPIRLLQSTINMIIYCKSTFCSNNSGRLCTPLWELNDNDVTLKRADSGQNEAHTPWRNAVLTKLVKMQ